MHRRILPTVQVRLFKPGTKVTYQGIMHTVDHITISRDRLMVKLLEIEHIIDSDKLSVQLTEIDFKKHRTANYQ